MAKQQSPQLQNTSQTDTTIPIKGMSKDPNSSLVSKENWTHAINAINNSDDGDVGTLGNEQANKKCGYAPFTIIGAIHLYKDKWVLFSTNNEQSEIGTWDDSECKYERIFNDYTCYNCEAAEEGYEITPCLNFDTQHLITGASKENFDCSWQVYWDDGKNPSRTLNLDNIPYIQEQVTGPPVDSDECITFSDTECIDCEKLRLAPLVEIPCVELSKSADGGQLRNGSYQVFIAYAINDQVVGDYYGISNIQPLFAHEDMMSGLEIKISNLDKQFEYFQLVVASNNQNEMQAKEIGFYSTHQSHISIDYINQALKTIPLTTIPLSTPAFEKSDHMYVVNDYLIRQGPTAQYDFNYQPLANEIHTHWLSAKFPSDYYKKGGSKPTFMRDEVYSFFIRFVYNTGEKSASFHIPGRDTSINFNNNFSPINPWNFIWNGSTLGEDAPQPGQNDLSTYNWNLNGSFGAVQGDRVFEVYNTAPNDDENFWNLTNTNSTYFQTDDGGESIAEGHMAYWESTERYPNDPIRWNGVSGNPVHDLCGKPIRHHKMPDETFVGSGPGGFLDRADATGEHIHLLGVNFWGIKWPRYSDENGAPTGALIPNIIGYEILVGSREGNRSIIAKGIARNMRMYDIPPDATGKVDDSGNISGYIPNYPFNSAQDDPYLNSTAAGATGFTWNDNTATEGVDNNWFPYPKNYTAQNVFTLHSPELSFNRPFLSPFEIRTYGLTFGSAIGRFIASEKHPKQKLLRNLSMWVALMVGVGYAIMEMRGKRKKKFTPPKALNVGLDHKQDERTGGNTPTLPTPGDMNVISTSSGLFATVPPGGGTITPGVSMIDTSQGGNAAESAAPATTNDSGMLLIDNNTMMMDQYSPTLAPNQEQGDGAVPFTTGGRNATLTTATMLGAPKIGMNAPPTGPIQGWEASTRTAYSNITQAANQTDRGFIGAGTEVEYEGSRFESAPSLAQLLFGVFNFMNFTAEGGQHIIDLIYNLVSYQDYAYKYGGHGLYLRTNHVDVNYVHRMLVNKARYIGSTIQNLSADVRINNLQRPSTVALLAHRQDNSSASCFNLPTVTEDDSRFIIGDFQGWYNPSQWRVSPIAAHYISLKVAFRNQYGQIDQIKQLPTGCSFKFKDTLQNPFDYYFVGNDNTPLTNPCPGITCPDGQIIDNNTCTCMDYIVIGPAGSDVIADPVDQNTRFMTPTIFGGDCYINRYTEKVIMPFFWDFLTGQPDGFPYDYRLRANVPRPIYWMNTAKYDLSELVRFITGFGWLTTESTGGLMAQSPNQLFFLDRDGADRTEDGPLASSPDPAVPVTTGGPTGGGIPTPGTDPITSPSGGGGKSLFHIKSAYMYTHCNGVQDFFAESTLNVGLRDWEDVDKKKHYDFTEYTDTEALFHSDIIRDDNFYKYDASLSKTRFNTQLISWGFIQPRDYDPLVAEFCYTHYPKRLIYSLQAQKEAKKDFWRVFLPMNYKDFKNRVNVIKPISKSGAIVLFPNLAPTLFQGVDQLQTDLGTKLTIGDGGLFSQPMQNIVNAEAAHEYGSCESARSVVNTPSGIFYISQAQGKVFQYNGQGIVNIANQGMKQWFNKYLPSVLLNQFPELEECNGWVDNPVAGVGCQTVYDPNYDIVYFCKKDYEAINPECVEFVPCEGFFWNETECGEMEQTANCPFGYTYNPNNPQGQECELITQTEANMSQGEAIEMDVVFVVGAGFHTRSDYSGRTNVGNMQQVVGGIIAGLQTELNDDILRIGLCHYGAGRNNRDPLFSGQWDPSTPEDPDKMFEPSSGTFSSGIGGYGNQIPLTNNTTTLMNWLGQSTGQVDNSVPPSPYFGDYLPDWTSTYGQAVDQIDKPRGNDIAAGMWTGQNLLYGFGSRQARKVLILLSDSFAYNQGTDAGRYSTFEYTNNITGTDIFAPDGVTSMTVNPQTADMDIGARGEISDTEGGWAGNFELNQNHASWVNQNILNNSDYQTSTFEQITMNIAFYSAVPEGLSATALIPPYLQQFCDDDQYYQVNTIPPLQYVDGEIFINEDGQAVLDISSVENSILDNVESVVSQLQGIIGTDSPPTEPCPPDCEFIWIGDDPMCECITYAPAEFSSVKLPIELTDENYFKNVSWTVSYDPKAKAWISFHDWHPDLTIPSLNHFFTTKNFIDTSDPQCPPGFEYDPITMGCCQTNESSVPASVIIDEAVPTVNVIPQACPLDIVFAVDVTGSTTAIATGGQTTYPPTVFGFFCDMVDQFVAAMADDMWNGAVQVGLMNWSASFPLMIQNTTGANTNGSNKTPQVIGGSSVLSMSNWVGNQVTPPVTDISGNIITPGVYDYMYDDGVNPPSQRLWGSFCQQTNAGTNTGPAFERSQQQLSDVTASALGDRTMNPQYKRVLVFLSDGQPYGAPRVDQGSDEGREIGVFTPNVNCNDCGGCYDSSGCNYSTVIDGSCDSLEANWIVGGGYNWPYCGQGERFQNTMNSCIPSDPGGAGQGHPYWVDFPYPEMAKCTAWNSGLIGSPDLDSTTIGIMGWPDDTGYTGSDLAIYQTEVINNSFYRLLANELEYVWGLSSDVYYPNMIPSTVTSFIEDLRNSVTCQVRNCICPDNYVRVSTPASMSPGPYDAQIIGSIIDSCEGEEGSERNGICRHIHCECDEDLFGPSYIEDSFFESGICDVDVSTTAIADIWGISTIFNVGIGDPAWDNPDPLMCNWQTLCCIDPSFDKGGIWKHNDRCDLFTNYYEFDYPWEVEIVESKGQTVNTVRSIEYQLESYIYNGNLDDNCGDRFHDLDWNFDEVIIHNTEQVSGLLRLDLNPKNDVPLITTYPIISGNDIRILYSKEEQKYRFNQFWDITYDRGEFSGATQSIFLTELNGYIRELNQANLNYFKPAFERKKFRHYWNKVLFRRSTSENRQMILKLANTKINASFR